MATEKLKVLIVEKNQTYAKNLSEILSKHNGRAYDFKCAVRLSDSLKIITEKNFDVVLLDLNLPDSKGLDTLSDITSKNNGVPFVILTERSDVNLATQALGKGAQDYLVKGQFDGEMLSRSIRYAIEQKKFEMELQKSERKYRSLFENSVDGLYITTPEGKYVDVNQSLVNILGYSSKDELMSIDVRKQLYVLEKERPSSDERNRLFETRLKKKDGSIINVQISSSVIFEEGKPKYYQGIVRNITDKIIFQNQLEKVAREWSTTFDAIEDAISITDLEGNILRVNKSMSRIFNKSFKEIIGKNCPDMIRGISELHGKCPLIHTGNTNKREIKIIRINGKYYNCIVDPILDENNNITSMVHILSDTTRQKKGEEEIKDSLSRIKKTFEQTVAALSQLVEVRDPYTSGHQKRVSDIASAIAADLKLKKEIVESVRLAALIHDIGKISIPASILSKPGQLTEIEKNMIETHSKTGYDIVKEIDFPYPIATIILQHHERLDGSGYPYGLKGDEIMLEAKIITVADVFEAMSSHRPYREANSMKESFDEILKNKGILYDTDAVDSCIRVLTKKMKIEKPRKSKLERI